MDLSEAAHELYGLEPGAFTARRAELVAGARAAGDRDLARDVGQLRRPTVAAWLVNTLVAGGDDDVDGLVELGRELRAAQADLQGDRIRELSQRRQQLVARLVAKATARAPASETVRREVEATWVAAVADEAAAEAVVSGELTRALSYTGFGEVDLSAATALPRTPRAVADPGMRHLRPVADPGPRRRAGHVPAATADKQPDVARRDAAAEAAAAAAAEARATRDAAAQAAAEAVERAASAHAHAAELAARVTTLQRELSDVRRFHAEATRDAERADRAVERAEHVARRAARAARSVRGAQEP